MFHPRPPFLLIFGLFQTKISTICTKSNVHPVYGAGIRTHDLQNMSTRPGLPPINIVILSTNTFLCFACVTPEAIVYSDRPSIHYPPIADAFVNTEFFSSFHKQFDIY